MYEEIRIPYAAPKAQVRCLLLVLIYQKILISLLPFELNNKRSLSDKERLLIIHSLFVHNPRCPCHCLSADCI